MTDTTVRRLQFAAVLLVAALAAVVSYSHIRVLALTHGGDQLTAALLPLLIDGTVAAMSFAMVRAAKDEERTVPWLARFMLILSVGATLAANTAFGAAYGVTGALLWTLPAVMFVGCVEVSVLMVRKTQPAVVPLRDVCDVLTYQAPKPAEVKPEPAPVMVTVRETAPVTSRATSPRHRNDKLVRLLLSSPDMTEPELASKVGCSVSTVSRTKRRLAMANGNGKVH